MVALTLSPPGLTTLLDDSRFANLGCHTQLSRIELLNAPESTFTDCAAGRDLAPPRRNITPKVVV